MWRIQESHPVSSIGLHPSGGFVLVGSSHPVLRLYDAAGKSYCPDALGPEPQQPPTRKPPADIENPPIWRHSGSTTAQTIPWANEGVVYVSAHLSGRHGPLAVLRWKAPRTPVETFGGKPFPGKEEVRFWSLDFSGPPRIALADREVPQLGDGSRCPDQHCGPMEVLQPVEHGDRCESGEGTY